VEVAKNLILAGPKQVTIYDPTIVSVEDVGRNFYCRSEHIGKISRAEASLFQLKDLNPGVHVHIGTDTSVEHL
jgi:molybdopterin/thiamine biosynthesis adenylyltransferase